MKRRHNVFCENPQIFLFSYQLFDAGDFHTHLVGVDEVANKSQIQLNQLIFALRSEGNSMCFFEVLLTTNEKKIFSMFLTSRLE
jgi:hypothetical protein